jgi:phage/conjugal plasmid C-4 type zinc finger TraR family protein
MGHEATRSRTLASGLAWIQAARRECQARLAAARDSGTIPGRPIEMMDSVQHAVATGLPAVARRLLSARLEALAQAEARWRDGHYGVCEGCGEVIPTRRLMALPEARHCVTCAEAMETGRTGPVLTAA